MPAIRPARPDEADHLTALCRRSKAMWGYDAAFMALCEPSLTVHPDDIADGRVLVSDGSDGRPAGIAAVSKPGPDGRCELTLIFVEPDEVGCGHGSRLFEALTSIARARGGKVLEVLADPHAMAFYRRMGCRETGDAPSDAIPGRRLPTLEFDLVQTNWDGEHQRIGR